MATLIGLIVGFAIALALIAIFTFIFRWLWNTTMPEVFGINEVSFWQAFRLLLLSAILFGGGTKVVEESHEIVPDETIAQATE